MATVEAWRAASRRLRLGAVLTLANGVERTLESSDILSFTLNEGADSPLMPGNVIAASCELEIANMNGAWLPGGSRLGQNALEGATARVHVEILENGAWSREALGTFVITRLSAPEQRSALRLSGVDAIGAALSGTFVDTLTYPCTLLDLWLHAVAQTDLAWSGTVPGGAAIIDVRPNWGAISVRQALGFIAAAAGCFVRLGRDGALLLERCWRGTAEAQIGAGAYMTLNREFETFGPVDALKITPAKGADGAQEAFTVFADGQEASVGATLSVERNPLFISGTAHVRQLAEGMLAQLSGLTLERCDVRWRGDPAVGVGAHVLLTDVKGTTHLVTVTRQSLRFDGGLSATCACETPEQEGSGLTRAITPEGGLNAAALVGVVDGGLLAAGSVTAGAIRAGSVTAEKLSAGAVTAEKIAAGAVTADHLAADAVSAGSLQALEARLGQITAQTIDADALSAAFAHLFDLAADKIAAGQISAGSLSAALAELVAARAASLDVEYGKIRDLNADQAIITDGVAGELYIERLAVTRAMLLSATLGELVLGGEDGNYYRLSVRADGILACQAATPTAEEIAAGETADGRAILATDADIGSLNAQSVKAQSAILSSVFAQALTAGTISAGQAMLASATVPELYAATIKALGDSIDISANRSIAMLIGESEAARQTAEAAEAQAAQVRRWMTFGDDGLRQGRPDSAYATLIDDVGFHILQRGGKIGSFARRQLAAEELRVGRVAASAPRCVLREAADGGMIITVEGLT